MFSDRIPPSLPFKNISILQWYRVWLFASLCTAVGSKIKLPVNKIGSRCFGVLATYLVLLIDFGFFSVGNGVYEQY